MPKEQEQREEQKYFERLNIPVLKISSIKHIIKTDIKNTISVWDQGKDVEKQCFHIIGPAGVGKTQVCEQIAEELTEELFGEYNKEAGEDNQKVFQILMIKAPVLSRDDFIIPFPIIGSNGVDDSFKMLYSDFVPKDLDSYGIFVIDEFSRGDHSLQQLMWQVQNECKIHLTEFPKHWFIISVDNPDDSEYQMDTMEDAAGLRRQLHLYTEVSVPDFLEYAINNTFHPTIIEFIQAHPDRLYDFDAQKVGMVFANPASYERLSDHMWKFEYTTGVEPNFDTIEYLAAGLLNIHQARLFIEFVRDGKTINPKDIFYEYSKSVRPRILKLIKENDNATLSDVVTGFITFLTSSRPAYTHKEEANVAKFLVDIPADCSAVYSSGIDALSRLSPEFTYMTTLHLALMKNEPYKRLFYESSVQLSRQKR